MYFPLLFQIVAGFCLSTVRIRCFSLSFKMINTESLDAGVEDITVGSRIIVIITFTNYFLLE